MKLVSDNKQHYYNPNASDKLYTPVQHYYSPNKKMLILVLHRLILKNLF